MQRAQRFALEMPIRYRGTGNVDWHEGTTINISTSGILFRAAASARPPADVQITVAFPAVIPGHAGAELRCRGTLIREVSGSSPHAAPVFAVAIGRCRIARRRDHAKNLNNIAFQLLPT